MLSSQGLLGGQLPVPSACLDHGKPPKSRQLLIADPPPIPLYHHLTKMLHWSIRLDKIKEAVISFLL